jgi:hypothetical protein
MRSGLFSLLILVLGLGALLASGRRLTNAQQLARGLPPNPPVRRYDPTRRRSECSACRVHVQSTRCALSLADKTFLHDSTGAAGFWHRFGPVQIQGHQLNHDLLRKLRFEQRFRSRCGCCDCSAPCFRCLLPRMMRLLTNGSMVRRTGMPRTTSSFRLLAPVHR